MGGYASPQAFVDGMTAAVWVGAVAVALAGVAAVLIPPKQDVVPDSVSLLERDGVGRARPVVEGELACEADAAG